MAVWVRLFSKTSPLVLAKALDMITLNSERMPTPATLQRAIAEIRSGVIYGGGAPRHTEGIDRNNIPCWFWENDPTVPAYASSDCPEGKVFLALLADIAQSQESSKVRTKQAGIFECQDCKQSYPMTEFMKHKCPSKDLALQRIQRRTGH